MPIIKFKDKKRDKKEEMETAVGSSSEEDYQRRINLPVNDAILDECEIDQMVIVTIIGTVTAIRSSTSEDYNEKSITVTAQSIEVYENDENEDAGMKAGYRRS